MRKIIIPILLAAFAAQTIWPVSVRAQVAPAVPVSASFPQVPTLQGITVYPDNPFTFDFLIQNASNDEVGVLNHPERGSGKDDRTQDDQVEGFPQKEETMKLVKYFLAALTMPSEDLWVNLNPEEPDRIIADEFGQTVMGRDMLAADYLLKQLTASLLSPESEEGEKFWDGIYKEIYEKKIEDRKEEIDKSGNQQMEDRFSRVESLASNISRLPSDDLDSSSGFFSRVWIVPDVAQVYVHENNIFVAEARLSVRMDAEGNNVTMQQCNNGKECPVTLSQANGESDVTLLHLKNIILPEIERQINESPQFAQLRQIYHALILATYYKRMMGTDTFLGNCTDQKGCLSPIFNRRMIAGIDDVSPQKSKEIFQQYLATFKDGVNEIIKEDYDPQTQEIIARKYIVGGVDGAMIGDRISESSRTRARQFFNQHQKDLTRVTVAVANDTSDAAEMGHKSDSNNMEEFKQNLREALEQKKFYEGLWSFMTGSEAEGFYSFAHSGGTQRRRFGYGGISFTNLKSRFSSLKLRQARWLDGRPGILDVPRETRILVSFVVKGLLSTFDENGHPMKQEHFDKFAAQAIEKNPLTGEFYVIDAVRQQFFDALNRSQSRRFRELLDNDLTEGREGKQIYERAFDYAVRFYQMQQKDPAMLVKEVENALNPQMEIFESAQSVYKYFKPLLALDDLMEEERLGEPKIDLIKKWFPLVYGYLYPVEFHKNFDHETQPQLGVRIKQTSLVRHVFERGFGRKILGLENQDISQFHGRTNPVLSKNAFREAVEKYQWLKNSKLYPYFLTAYTYHEVSKSGLDAFREDWERIDGIDLKIANKASGKILRNLDGGRGLFQTMGIVTGQKSNPQDLILEEFFYRVIENRGFYGQKIRGEVTLEILTPLTDWIRENLQELKMAMDVNSDDEAVGRIGDVLYLFEFIDVAAVREGLMTDELNDQFLSVFSEIKQMIMPVSIALTPTWRDMEFSSFGDIATAKAQRAYLKDRLSRFRIERQQMFDEDPMWMPNVLDSMADEEIAALFDLIKNFQGWYVESATSGFCTESQIKIIAYAIRSAKHQGIDISRLFHISFIDLMKEVATGRQQYDDYSLRIMETYLRTIDLHDILLDWDQVEQGHALTQQDRKKAQKRIKPLISEEIEIDGQKAVSFRFNLTNHARHVMALLKECDNRPWSTEYQTLKNILIEFYGLKVDHFDRVSNEKQYLETMASAKSDKERLADYVKGPIVYDIGPAGGAMLQILEDRKKELGIERIIAVDISEEALKDLERLKRERNWSAVEFVHGDSYLLEELIKKHNLPRPNSIIFCSILHEIFSYDVGSGKFNLESVKNLLRVALRVIEAGGRILTRDGVIPEDGEMPQKMFLQSEEDKEFFDNYVAQFKGRKIEYTEKKLDNEEDVWEITLKRKDAMEFLFTLTWGAESFPFEVQEQYGFATRQGYGDMWNEISKKEKVGIKEIEIPKALQSYTQQGYIDHLYDRTPLFDVDGSRRELPPSNMVYIVEKSSDPAMTAQATLTASVDRIQLREEIEKALQDAYYGGLWSFMRLEEFRAFNQFLNFQEGKKIFNRGQHHSLHDIQAMLARVCKTRERWDSGDLRVADLPREARILVAYAARGYLSTLDEKNNMIRQEDFDMFIQEAIEQDPESGEGMVKKEVREGFIEALRTSEQKRFSILWKNLDQTPGREGKKMYERSFDHALELFRYQEGDSAMTADPNHVRLKKLVSNLTDSRWDVREKAVWEIVRTFRDSAYHQDVIPAVLPRLKDSNASVQAAAIKALGLLGSNQFGALAALREVAEAEEDIKIRREALRSLRRIGVEIETTTNPKVKEYADFPTDKLISFLYQNQTTRKEAAIILLARRGRDQLLSGKERDEFENRLVEFFSDRNAYLREEAARAAGVLRLQGRGIREGLELMSVNEKEFWEIWRAAQFALEQITDYAREKEILKRTYQYFLNDQQGIAEEQQPAYEAVMKILELPSKKIMVVGNGLTYLPVYLALLGKNVVFVDHGTQPGIKVEEEIKKSMQDLNITDDVVFKSVSAVFGENSLPLTDEEIGTFDLITLVDAVNGEARGYADNGWNKEIQKWLNPRGGFLLVDNGDVSWNSFHVVKRIKEYFPHTQNIDLLGRVTGELNGSSNNIFLKIDSTSLASGADRAMAAGSQGDGVEYRDGKFYPDGPLPIMDLSPDVERFKSANTATFEEGAAETFEYNLREKMTLDEIQQMRQGFHRILDVGISTNLDEIKWLLQFFPNAHVDVVEINLDKLKILRESILADDGIRSQIDRITLYWGNAVSLNSDIFQDDMYDFVFSHGVDETMFLGTWDDDPSNLEFEEEFVMEMFRLVKPAGYVVASISEDDLNRKKFFGEAQEPGRMFLKTILESYLFIMWQKSVWNPAEISQRKDLEHGYDTAMTVDRQQPKEFLSANRYSPTAKEEFGGIDFNPNQLNIGVSGKINSDAAVLSQGQSAKIPMITRFDPVIIDIQPVTPAYLAQMMGIQ